MLDSVANYFTITNASNKQISHLGHIMVPAEHRNYKPSFEHVTAKVNKTARTKRQVGVIGRKILADALLLSLNNYHSFGWVQVKVNDLKTMQNTIDKTIRSPISGNVKYLIIQNNG